jgi:3'-5' exoribonuclease
VVIEFIESASLQDVEDLVPKSPRSLETMEEEWLTLVDQVDDEHLRALLMKVWEDPQLKKAYCAVPGGKKIHHPYKGGLLEHSLAVAKGAYLLWRKVYPSLNKDLLIAGGLLHDIGKVEELTWQGTEPEYTDQGRLMGHVMLGGQILVRLISQIEGFPEELALKVQHIVASHHGEPEVGAAQKPMFKEAVVIHFLDGMDSKLSGFDVFVQKDTSEGNWTAFHRWFDRYIYKG